MYKQKRTVLHMLLTVDKLPQLAAAVEVPHFQFTIVAPSQQAPLLQIVQNSHRVVQNSRRVGKIITGGLLEGWSACMRECVCK